MTRMMIRMYWMIALLCIEWSLISAQFENVLLFVVDARLDRVYLMERYRYHFWDVVYSIPNCKKERHRCQALGIPCWYYSGHHSRNSMINDIEEHLRSPNSTKISKKGKIKGKAEWIHIVESRAFNSTTGGPANRSIADEVQGILTIQMDVWLNPKDLALSGVDVNRIWRLGPFLNMPRPHPDGVHRQFGVYGKDCLNTSVGGLTGAQSLWEDLDWNWGLDSKHKRGRGARAPMRPPQRFHKTRNEGTSSTAFFSDGSPLLALLWRRPKLLRRRN